MTNLKEYQHHIADTRADRKGMAICGARLIHWHYMDIDHAFLSAPLDRIQPCPDCAKKVIAVFSACE